MAWNKQQIQDAYGRLAGRYDFSLNFYRLAGFRLAWYRRLAVESLALHPGDTVIDLACGTGLNFHSLYQAVGEEGRIIGVDLTEGMLEQARRRAAANGWSNLELVRSDLAEYSFPDRVAGILSTYAITLVPEFDAVIRRGAEALQPAGRLAVLDFKKPDRWPEWLIRLGAWAYKPYGVTLDLAGRHPWESIRHYLHQVLFREFYFGGLYLAAGEKPTGLFQAGA